MPVIKKGKEFNAFLYTALKKGKVTFLRVKLRPFYPYFNHHYPFSFKLYCIHKRRGELIIYFIQFRFLLIGSRNNLLRFCFCSRSIHIQLQFLFLFIKPSLLVIQLSLQFALFVIHLTLLFFYLLLQVLQILLVFFYAIVTFVIVDITKHIIGRPANFF